MKCEKCEKPIKSRSDCVVAYDYRSYFFKLPPQLTIYHKNCFNEYRTKSSMPIATVDSNQLKKLNDSSFKLLIFWIVIGTIPLVMFVAFLVKGVKLDESIVALFFFIFPSFIIYIYASRLRTIKEIENLPATKK